MATASTDPKAPKVNRLGLTQNDYRGLSSTLCAGCGHDSVTNQIIKSFWEMGIEPHQVAKMSGIGCSSKSTAYFLSRAHAFNGCHGRMTGLATGSHLANHKLIHIGVSGDGDTASIGLAGFMHTVRRDVPCIYVIENNGVYGLTKGQLSATADKGHVHRTGQVVDTEPMDCCAMAIELGCRFVARSFSGDFEQLNALLKAAMAHRGFALIDVISPCISFNNHEGSTRSLAYVKSHTDLLHEMDFVPGFELEPQQTEPIEPGMRQVNLVDGSYLLLKKVHEDHDPSDRMAALLHLEEARAKKIVLTGLFYHQPEGETLDDKLNMVDQPLATLPESMVRPGPEVLSEVMARFR